MDIKFLKYEETPDMKCLGIAHVMYNGIVLKFKVTQTNNGIGIFPPAYPRQEGEKTNWQQWFIIDSQYSMDQIKELIRKNINSQHATPVSNQQAPQYTQPGLSTPQYTQQGQSQPIHQAQGDLPF